MMRRGDKMLIIIIAAVVVLGYGFKVIYDKNYKNAGRIATIEIDGEVYGEYDLEKVGNKDIELELPGDAHSLVEFKDGMVRVREANCPDQVCVRTGWISKPGEIIVCLPYRIIIKISGEKQDVDINTY